MKKAKILGVDYLELQHEIEYCREKALKIVMCSGTFDLFHIGHMKFLEDAKSRGDILIVAVKSDKAAALKKDDPPVLEQEIRMETVAYNSLVDYVAMVDFEPKRGIPFEFENVASYQWLNMFNPLLELIRPDIFVHEDSNTLANARKQMFSKYNIEGVIHQRMEGISTTKIIENIEKLLLLKLQ